VVPGDFVTIRENSNSVDGRTYDFVAPAADSAAMTALTCVKEVSRVDTGFYRQIIFEGLTGDCVETLSRSASVGATPEIINFRVYPDTEPPVLGVYFDMDLSVNREMSLQKNGYGTIRANEAATETGYAWEVPVLTLECVDVVDTNYGDFKTGFIQYLFLAKNVGSFCTDEITVTRSANFVACPGCSEKITISVTTIAAADPTAAVTSIINDSDSDAVKAAKQLCLDSDQEQWNTNTDECEAKCQDPLKPWYNSATG